MRKKKCDFFSQNFPKVSQNAFFAYFFKVLPAARKMWPKQDLFSALVELGKSA